MSKPNEVLEAPVVEVDISEAEELAGIVEAEKAAKPPKEERPARDAKPAKEPKAEPETVPHAALHEERERRKAAEREHREFKKQQEERNARLDERLRMLSEAMTPRQQPIDPRTNPQAFAQQQAQRLEALERERAQEKQTQAESQRREQAESQMWDGYRASGREFTRTTPDFPEAYQFLLASRYQELAAFGMSEREIADALKADEYNLAFNSQQRGTSPAETIYQWAQLRGYKAGGEPANKGKSGMGDLDRLRNAQDASETLSKHGGSAAGSSRLSLDSIDRMSKDEFEAFVAKMNNKDPNGFDKLMARLEGGRK